MQRWIAVGLVAAGCGGDPSVVDALPDAGPRCNEMGVFGPAELLTSLSSDLDDVSARLRPDELELVFARRNSGNTYDLWTASRLSRTEPFGAPSLLTSVNSINSDLWPTLSPDGQTLMFDADRTTPGTFRIWASTRISTTVPFGPPSPRGELTTGDVHPMLASGTALYFASAGRGGLGAGEIFRSDITSGTIGTPVELVGGVNTSDDEVAPAVTSDERQIFFRRVSGVAPDLEADVYTASRSTAQDGFGPSSIVPISQAGVDEAPTWISPDACELYFHSDAPVAGGPAGFNLYVTRRGF